MVTIDLHGVKHEPVESIMVGVCAEHATPFIVITGNSPQMKKLVAKAVNNFGLSIRDAINNPGRVVVDENR